MSKMFKKVISLCLVMLGLFMLVSCDKDEKKTITIIQYVSANALDDARVGVIEALADAGFVDGENVEIIVQNPQADSATLTMMAESAVRKSDLIVCIATPVAIAVKAECELQGSNVPVLFTAVTDPVASGLVASNEVPGANITGTNDMNPVADQVDLILELAPGIKKLGVLYNVAETNSQVQAEMVKAQAALKNVEVVVKTVSEAIEISAATTALIQTEKVEAIYIPTDNLMASNMPAIAAVSDELKVPTVCGEAGMVAAGGTITYSINYKSLGYLTGEMAAKILSGTPCSEVPSTSVDASGLEVAINDTSIQNIGIEVPQSIKDKLSK